MFSLLSLVFRYIFIALIYLFMIGIIRLIYLDIRNIRELGDETGTYLKLINMRESVPFKIKDEYFINREITMGRDSSNDIVLRDPYTSKRHCRIFLKDGEYHIEDINSSNGTYVNNNRITGISRIYHGDRVKVGQIEFLFVKNT
ncbi:FHA domain-containing protein FhaB [Andreesenia angusta]|uniref:FHA domain-containing protein FhaB n=1 Tax=Andreesenia angusta TaxID=39480 RepID=A0A1S1V6U7_9FIRM|nr:FHA domain-containing protein [Andreesenia angusta]OHW62135.1 FHA domain-containing protein FhaB [Andreesenia angusta]